MQRCVDRIQQVFPGINVDAEGDLFLQRLVICKTGVFPVCLKYGQPGKDLRLRGENLVNGRIAIGIGGQQRRQLFACQQLIHQG